MNIVNSVRENFGDVDQKYKEMTDGGKISMFVGLISAGLLVLSVILKKYFSLDPIEILKQKVGLDVFIILVASLLAVSGGVNFVTSKTF